MSETAGQDLRHLSAATASLGRVFARPKVLAGLCVIVLAGLGWLYLALLSAAGGTGSFGRFGFVEALCGTLQDGFAGPYAAVVVFSMWCAMTLVMMLPSAAPMILHLHGNRGHCRAQERTDRLAIRTRRRLRSRVVRIFGLRRSGTDRIDFGGVARSGYGLGEPAIVWCDFYLRRHVSIFGAQTCVSYAVPSSVSRFLHELGYDSCRGIQTRSQARYLLCRVLLGDDAFDVRGRPNEYRLDGRYRHRHDD